MRNEVLVIRGYVFSSDTKGTLFAVLFVFDT